MGRDGRVQGGEGMISIVIPVWNQHEMTLDCLRAVRENTTDYEIVVVDNGSSPAFAREPQSLDTILRNETNLGFPVAVNQGIRAAKGDVIVLLNNDVIVTPGAINRLADLLSDYAITAPVANYCAGLQQEATLPTYNDDAGLYEVAKDWAEQNKGKVREVNFVIGFCMAFKKSLFDEIGPLDESLWPCCGEEVDWCYRARVAGHKIGIACDVYVHHIGSQTFKKMEDEGLVEYWHVCRRNDMHLEKKWGKNFWSRQVGEIEGPYELDIHPEKLRLNLGCSTYYIPGFVNIDTNPNRHPDLIADVLNLPYGPNMIDEIYAGHLLEHLTWDEGQAALKHWWTLMKRGAEIRITVPNFDLLAKRYLDNPTPDNMRFMNDWYIYSYVQESHHRYTYGPALLREAMKLAGFGDIEEVPQDCPLFTANVDDQISYKGIK
jgi:GT2 family glycosyltransferase/predicted SAM-dependent methyltransferase